MVSSKQPGGSVILTSKRNPLNTILGGVRIFQWLALFCIGKGEFDVCFCEVFSMITRVHAHSRLVFNDLKRFEIL